MCELRNQLTEQKTLLVSVGGVWKDIVSHNNVDLQLTNLCYLLIDLFENYDIDGIDFDIEGIDQTANITQLNKYFSLIKSVHERYPDKILTLAVNGELISQINNLSDEVKNVKNYINYVLLMGYDYGNGANCANQNSPWNKIADDMKKLESYWDKDHIYVIFPFYNKDPQGAKAWKYHDQIRPQDDSPYTIFKKAKLVRTLGYGGVGAWEISQDDDSDNMSQSLYYGYYLLDTYMPTQPQEICQEIELKTEDISDQFFDVFTKVKIGIMGKLQNALKLIIHENTNNGKNDEQYNLKELGSVVSHIYDVEFVGNTGENNKFKICLPFDRKKVLNPANLTLMHFKNQTWEDITEYIDSDNGYVCGNPLSFSPFVIIEHRGDLDNDGDVDRKDVNIVMRHRNQPASSCPECDIDGDGTITVLDARKVITMCTCPRCVCAE